MTVPAYAWAALLAAVVILLLVDMLLVGRGRSEPSVRRAAAWSIAWTTLGVTFTAVLAAGWGGARAGEYLTGFVIEKSLSLDNLFVFAVLFSYFAVPGASRRRALLFGIAGAIVLRGLFVLAGAAAIDAFHATIYLFGALLILTAIKLARGAGEHVDPEHTLAFRALRRIVPLTSRYDGERLFTREGGRRVATPLFAALVMVAAFDVLFAVDSVPAIFAVSREPFIVFAANAFSLLGMTSLYFLLDGMLGRFRYLSQALALILAFVGAKMLLSDVWHPPVAVSLGVIVGTLALAVAASAWRERLDGAAQEA